MTELVMLRNARRTEIAALGPRPQYWQPFHRARWDRARKAIGERYYYQARELYIIAGQLTPALESRMQEVWA